MIISEEDYIEHIGTPRHSGRWPWGSTNNVPGNEEEVIQRNASWLDYVKDLKKQGLSDADIAQGMGISSTQLRARKSISISEKKAAEINMAQRLSDKGYSRDAIAKRMGLSGESYVRTLLAPGAMDKARVLTNTADTLQKHVDEKGLLEVGTGTEHQLKISKEKMNAALTILKEKGYVIHTVPVAQLGTQHDTKTRVLAPPGTTWGEVRKRQSEIQTITDFSDDNGRTVHKIHDPLVVHPDRVQIRYADEGGKQADGVVYVRPGVDDISLGAANYAQVRIQVGPEHYIKGMAMYKTDLPKGVDLVFNTNKQPTGNKLDALKKLSDNTPELPFGSIVRQIPKDPKNPNSPPASAMNIVNSEGAWSDWSGEISSQFLSKQSPALAKRQLEKTYDRRKREFDEINQLTNPTVKKKLLNDFADSADSAAVHLKAAALPRMRGWHVILPIESMKPTEIYAPNFNNGERVVLIRHPHGGTFEIPELTVNNRQREARKVLPGARDAVGIHSSVAQRLSGADFDGDTVLVIPNNQRLVKHTPALEGLKNFDPIHEYKWPDGVEHTPMTDDRKGQLMGDISNLITDMTIKKAPAEHLARAIRHSMVVIDAQKHDLNYKLSAERNGIPALKKEYQGRTNAGASTLISRKKSFDVVPQRKERPASQGGSVDPVTGRKVYVETGKTYINRHGERVPTMERVKKLASTPDAHTLVSLPSGTPIENIYANHSNSLKDLAGRARLTALKTPRLQQSSSAKQIYSKQRQTLLASLAIAEQNAPRERAAQRVGNAAYRAKLQANPNLDKESRKKIKYQELERARIRMGVKKEKVTISPEEWDAIQAGAISDSVLGRILKHADMEKVREYATPKHQKLMSSGNIAKAKALFRQNYTRAEVAQRLGVSLSTLDASVKGSEQ